MRPFLETFLPLFVSIDAIGLIPVFLGVTGELGELARRRTATVAVLSASVICLVFMFVGNALFEFLGIRPAHFMIGGGIVLLVLAVLDIVLLGKPAMDPQEVVGVVPLGMPLIAGPATLSTVLLLSATHGWAWTALALAVNMLILVAALHLSSRIARWVGINALRAVSKVVMVLLAALAVKFIADGVKTLVRTP